MADQELDLIVLGSGPGGYVAAIRAAQLGLTTAVVEKDPKLGGTCLHRGCIPTKALLHTASTLDQVRKAGDLGIEVAEPKLDIAKAQQNKQKVVDKNAKGIEFLFKKNKIQTLNGFGRLTGPHEVSVEKDGKTTTHRARHILIATGSVPRDIPIAPADGEKVVNSDHILNLQRVPETLVVLGAGAVGTEFASIYTSFGSKVTLVEMLPRILPIEDADISKELTRVLEKRGIDVRVDTKLQACKMTEKGVSLTLEKGGKTETLDAEMLLVAVGRAPVSANLGLEALGVQVERGYIGVNEYMQTAVPHIYAIGDVVNTPWLAHVASAEGILAVEHIASRDGASRDGASRDGASQKGASRDGASQKGAGDVDPRPINYEQIPSCTYCEPEVASVGLTEAQAKEKGYDVQVGQFPFSALAKAAILGKPEGFVKVVRETRYDEILGVHIVGAHATDLIAEACVALKIESTNEELLRTIHAHPTLSEAVAEAAHAATGHAIHI